jgi:IclR family acetate operon transcriptional repressor
MSRGRSCEVAYASLANGEGVRQYSVRAVERTAKLLEALAEGNGRPKTLSELAKQAGMPEPTTLRYMATLCRLCLAEHQGDGNLRHYRLGIELFTLAERSVGTPDIRTIALPFMRELRDRYQETVNLAAFRQHRLVIVEALEGLRSIRQGAQVGDQDRLRSTALGKAILASYPDEEALALLREEGPATFTPKTIVTDRAMLRELRTIRDRGYAIDDEESEVGLRCVGIAIQGRRESRFGLSISGPSHLFTLKAAHDAGSVLINVGESVALQLNPGRAELRRGDARRTGCGT